ncbi:MAG: ComEC/Rec2 family competence protein, partial [Chloroflexota bacterium]
MGRSSRLALGAIAAAVAAGQVATSHLGAAIALALAAILLVHEVRPRLRARALIPVAVGAALIAIRLSMVQPPAAVPTGPPDGKGPWRMTVEATGSPRDGRQVATLVSAAKGSAPFSVAATLPRYPAIVPGDRVVVEGAIRPPPDSPYGEYLERIGAIGTLESRTLAVDSVPDDPGRWLEGLRRAAGDALTTVLPEPEAGLAAGILVGLRDRVDRDLAAAFTTAGVSHVVAISGWNIAIVAAAIAAMTGRLGRRRRSVVTILAIVAYVAFAGASASVVRAALMAGVVLLARESGRAGRATAALGWAATLLLVTDPALIGDAGFQLSSLATAGLIAWATPLTGWIANLGGGRVPTWLAEGLGVSLAAQAATLPIVLVSFGRLAILSPVVNLVVVPLVAPAMAVGVVALAGGAVVAAGAPAVIGAVLAAPGWVVLRILVTVVETAAGLPFASVTLTAPFDLMAAVAATTGIAGIVWWTKRRSIGVRAPDVPQTARPTTTRGAHPHHPLRRASIAALLVSLVVAGAVVAARPAGIPTISILDVGQGDAILVEGSRGGRLLIDGGPDPDRLLVALDTRIPPWDRRIDAVILSHPHEDHVAGLALLLERYHVGRVFEPGMRGPGPGYAAWLRDLARPGAPVRLGLAAGDRLSVDEIEFHVLWPIRGRVPATPPDGGTGINNVSVVLLGRIGDRRALLMGDVEEGIDPSLLADGLPHVDLLKVAHHGSRTATTQAFVDATRPRVAIASAGAGNPY